MSRGIRQSEMIYDSSRDALERKRALREIDDGQEILEKVEVKGDPVAPRPARGGTDRRRCRRPDFSVPPLRPPPPPNGTNRP